MAGHAFTLGIIGGSGMLGRAIARAVLERGRLPAERLWISNRSGRLDGFKDHPGITVTTDNQRLASASDVILLAVPPTQAAALSLDAPDALVVSVMAGVRMARLREMTGVRRVVRAMCSPAAAVGLAYSPWHASPEVTEADRAHVAAVFEACGATDEVADEDQIDVFTALTGPVPGFVAYYAHCMVEHAVNRGIPAAIADRAVRQLFRASGVAMACSEESPTDHVNQMIAYAGTTAAGLETLRASPVADSIADALDAATRKARQLGA